MPRGAFSELVPELELVATEAYQRARHFVERDPLLIGQDQEILSSVLCRRIRELTLSGESNVIRLANAAIRAGRQMAEQEDLREAA